MAAPALTGCFALGGLGDVSVNGCSTDADCEGGVCAIVSGVPACVATKADLPGLILEVRPSAEAGYGPNTPFLLPFGGQGFVAQSGAGLVVQHDMVLSQVTVSPIELFVDYDYKRCPTSPEGKLPADFTFYRSVVHAGLPEHEASAILVDGTLDTYAVDLPPGSYDVHVVPRAPEGCEDLPPPPTYHRGIDLSQGGKVDLHLSAPPRLISGTIAFPKGQDLTGWSIEVVEPTRGKPISRVQVLAVQPLDLYATYNLEYYWDFGQETSPVLRLRPPDGVDAPKLFWEVGGLSPLNPDDANIEANLVLNDLDAVGRDVSAFVVDTQDHPVVSSIAFRSLELSGDASTSAKYGIVVDTDPDGRFATKLLPGRYQVITYPTFDFTKAVSRDEWEIPNDGTCICGKGITVFDKTVVSGFVSLPNGEPLTAGAASVVPSRAPARPYLSSRLAADIAVSQPTSTSLGSLGEFSLLADPGLVDLLVVPLPGSLFPWLVRSQVDVKRNDDGAQIVDLQPLIVSYPAVLDGVVRDPFGEIVTSATVRAWMPVIATGTTDTVVIQIAEGSTGLDGRYLLPLAPSLSE